MNDLTDIQKKFINYTEIILSSNRLSHSYLIEMGDSSLEFPLVLLFVKMILCPKNVYKCQNLNCQDCNVCQLIDEGVFPDLEVIEADGVQIKKNQLLNLKEEFQNYSLLGTRRVYIIKDAEKLNPASANTILKFLEEPEDGIIAILLTKSRYHVLDTILSRCQVLSLIDSSVITDIDEKVENFIEYLIRGEDLFIKYKEILEFIPDKGEAKRVFDIVEQIFTQYLSGSLKDVNGFSVFKECSSEKILEYITIIEEETPKLMYNVNYKLWLDSIFSRFVEVN